MGILHVLRLKCRKLRILEKLNFHPCNAGICHIVIHFFFFFRKLSVSPELRVEDLTKEVDKSPKFFKGNV